MFEKLNQINMKINDNVVLVANQIEKLYPIGHQQAVEIIKEYCIVNRASLSDVKYQDMKEYLNDLRITVWKV